MSAVGPRPVEQQVGARNPTLSQPPRTLKRAAVSPPQAPLQAPAQRFFNFGGGAWSAWTPYEDSYMLADLARIGNSTEGYDLLGGFTNKQIKDMRSKALRNARARQKRKVAAEAAGREYNPRGAIKMDREMERMLIESAGRSMAAPKPTEDPPAAYTGSSPLTFLDSTELVGVPEFHLPQTSQPSRATQTPPRPSPIG
eukprot:CAMPEP_0182466718 /NCGR_PEP_ID=MMETSP1319-20130603/12527_1 /TAXON_ID=172717 /ORGANISM="Bolidomonas pacifica, Strain RCC208" /LENGTH=197 /DNA_ID=CAMNT_0024666751 /DNA_START=262 /DNA_END=852 /DNA_ORIENTATION=+